MRDNVQRTLSDFRGEGYDKGRPVWYQASWFVSQSLFVGAWWFPMRLKPMILRAFGATIGMDVHIRHRTRILWPWKLTIGDNAWVGEGAWLLNLEPITIGANACVSQEAFLCTGSHDYLSETFEFDNAPINIGEGAWVAAQAMVLRGVTVGTGATVGARAVVVHDVPDGALVPAGTRH